MKGQKGITLIALVITVIVLLILAGVALSALNATDLFGQAQDAASKYNASAANEATLLTNLMQQMNFINASVNPVTPPSGS